MTSPSYTYALTNGTTADASQVQQNFTDILNGVTDGTKDLSISALTCAGTATLNGHVNIGNASADDLTITASLAASIPVKTTDSFDLGSSSLVMRALYATTHYAGPGTAAAPSIAFTADADGSGTGLYRIGANNMGFAANGTAVGNISAAGLWTIGAAAGTSVHSLIGDMTMTNGSNAAPTLTISAGSGTGSALKFSQNSAARWTIFTNDLGPNGTGSVADTLNFYQQNAGRYDMSITSAGSVTIGNASTAVSHTIQASNNSGGILFVNGTAASDESAYMGIGKKSSTTTTTQIFMRFGTAGTFTDAGGIRANSGTPQFFAASDRRLKTGIKALADSLGKILALKPVTFRFKSDLSGPLVEGFVAQEFAEVFPDQVTKTDDGLGDLVPEGHRPWEMSKDGLIVHLVKAVQELKAEIDALKAS